jgi:hypothetical protein
MTKGPRDRGRGGKGATTNKGAPPLRLVTPAQADDLRSQRGDSRDSSGDSGDSTGKALAGELLLPGRRPKTRGPVLPVGVTAKEEGFARAVVAGCSQTEAFRRSHDAADMNVDTCSRQAVRVASRDRVRARIEQLLDEKEGSALHDRRKALTWALERLQREAETAETDGARVAAVSLIMRHHALLTDRQEVETADSRDASAIETALRAKLEKLLKTGT